jgi:putative OPT family oligopeptide transporter
MRLAADGPAREPDLTLRALASGLAVGALLCVANLYMGLKTGIWDSGHITASILAFALASGRLTRLENNVAQTAACAAGAVPAAAGLLGAIPALQLLGHHIPGWGIALWGLSLGVLGILFAAALRKRLLEDEQLPFPTGAATAEVIEALHSGGAEARTRTRALLSGGAVGAVLAWFRDGKPAIVPGSIPVPGTLGSIHLSTLGIGLSVSPLLWGVGMVIGPHVALSMLLGSAIGWAGVAPWLMNGPLRLAADRAALSDWLSWPGTAVLVGAAFVTLLQQARAARGALRDLSSMTIDRSNPRFSGMVLMAGAILVAIVVGKQVFHLLPLHVALALGLSVVGASICARSAGLTDVSPVGPVGQLTQVVYGGLAPRVPLVNIAAGSIVAGDATQTGVTLWSLRAGRGLHAPVRSQIQGAVVGCVIGAVLCVPAYGLLTSVYGLGSARLPAPTGVQWKAMGTIVAQGFGALPPGATLAVVTGAVAGVLLAGVGTSRLGRYVPSAFALGIGLLVPFEYSLAIAAGAIFLAVARRRRPEFWSGYGPVLGSGLIAGDSLIGLVAALLTSVGLL